MFTATTDLVVGSAPPERAGAASGISETGAELGGALGIAILGSIGVAVYRGQLADTLPAGIPGQAAAIARDTLGGAVGVAGPAARRRRPGAAGSGPDAFVQGMQLTVTLSATIAVVVAVMATVLLRQVPVIAQAEPGEQPPAPPEPAVAAQPEEQPIQIIRVGRAAWPAPG